MDRVVIEQCERALNSVKTLISAAQYEEAMNFVVRHGEYLVGLEWAMDIIIEEEHDITAQQFAEFEKACEMMKVPDNTRLADFRLLISD